ncbi:MAG: cation diffusion facilitator family transporter [Bacteroidetes bacterium]|nr:cation diffusion facilitator family transporter [Bacteroidota bacterium]
MTRKTSIARISIISNSILIILKVLIGIFSGAVSILSEAIHSLMDLLASIIAFFSVRISDVPADERHPYGHGKFENISGVIEAFLIFLAAAWIIYESGHKFLRPTEVTSPGFGIIVMGVSALINFFVSRKLYKVAKETDSVALEADALHLKTDVYTSLGVAIGLLLMMIGQMISKSALLFYIDPLIAIFVALLILKESFVLFKKAYSPLLDESLPREDVEQIKRLIDKYCSATVSYHDLRTRKAGNYRYIDFHLNLPEDMNVKSAHSLCDTIEKDIKDQFRNAEINIHVENF